MYSHGGSDGGASEMVIQRHDGTSQLTLSFRGQVYVFDSVTPDKVQAVLLLLGGCELSSGPQAEMLPQNQRGGVMQYPVKCSQPQRASSLNRFRQKRKERCFDKKDIVFVKKLLSGCSVIRANLLLPKSLKELIIRVHSRSQVFTGCSMLGPSSKLQAPIFTSRISRTLRARHHVHFEGPPKIAFLFLVRRDLPLDFLWGAFFKNGDVANFSIYIHSEPGFVFKETTTSSAFFYGRQLNNSIKVMWGELSMIEAESLLLEKALNDASNQRFVLLSDSCVPLYNFSYIYNIVMSSPKSFVDSFLDVKDNRYNSKMSLTIPEKNWRKGSQWVILIRRHAEIVVDDDIILPVFREFCKRWPPIDSTKRRQLLDIEFRFTFPWLKVQNHHDCIPDEHYVQTLLEMNELDDELERRTLTYTSWDQSAMREEESSWHPITFHYADAGPQKIKEIKDINHLYYESEHRTEWCQIHSNLTPCFLFARKFTRGAAIRLLKEGLIGSYDINELSNTTTPWMASFTRKRKSDQAM